MFGIGTFCALLLSIVAGIRPPAVYVRPATGMGAEAARPIHAASPLEPARKYSEAIEGNSFFIEEAYNQDPRRVHQMVNGLYVRDKGANFFGTFGQEWPVGGLHHQLSYEVSYDSLEGGAVRGLTDSFVDYRYQVGTKGTDWAVVTPRVSLVVPTGKVSRGLGCGVFGFQLALSASRRFSEHWVAHANAGWEFLPKAKCLTADGRNVRQDLSSGYFGGSVIWLAKPAFNVVFECLVTDIASFAPDGTVGTAWQTIISPGLRWAVNWGPSQLVPGIAAPLIFAAGKARIGLFLYIAFENKY